MGRKKKKIPTEGSGDTFGETNPFASLDTSSLPAKPVPPSSAPTPANNPPKKKETGMRIEIRRETSGKGGKTVTTLKGLTTLDHRSFDRLLKDLKTRLGTGGAAIPDGIQLQGDCRDQVEGIVSEKGFRPVRAGG